jgi:hypothetical protein
MEVAVGGNGVGVGGSGVAEGAGVIVGTAVDVAVGIACTSLAGLATVRVAVVDPALAVTLAEGPSELLLHPAIATATVSSPATSPRTPRCPLDRKETG